MTITGGCLCAQIRCEVDADLLWTCHCHCGACRKQTGAPISTWIGFPAGAVKWLGKTPARYRSSKDVERSFCSACGSTIGFHRLGQTSLAIGSVDLPAALPVAKHWAGHVWFKEHISWFETADNWTRYPEFPPGGVEELYVLSGQDMKE